MLALKMKDISGLCGLGWHGQYCALLQAGRSGDRIPVGDKSFCTLQTGAGAHPAYYSVGTRSFPGGKMAGG